MSIPPSRLKSVTKLEVHFQITPCGLEGSVWNRLQRKAVKKAVKNVDDSQVLTTNLFFFFYIYMLTNPDRKAKAVWENQKTDKNQIKLEVATRNLVVKKTQITCLIIDLNDGTCICFFKVAWATAVIKRVTLLSAWWHFISKYLPITCLYISHYLTFALHFVGQGPVTVYCVQHFHLCYKVPSAF